MHGDRVYADMLRSSAAWRASTASVVVIGHQKGRDTKEKIVRNFGMPRPRATQALAVDARGEISRRSNFSSTSPGLSGIEDEERGQAEAIGRNCCDGG